MPFSHSLSASSMTGSAVNLDKLALSLHFAEDRTLKARKGPTPTFTRASAATLIDVSGNIVYAPENLVKNSNNFVGTGWYRFFSCTTGALVDGPFASTQGRIINFGTSAFSKLYNAIPANSGDSVIISAWVRADVPTTIGIRVGSNSSTTSVSVTTVWTRIFVTSVLVGTSQATFLSNEITDTGKTFQLYGVQCERATSATDYVETTATPYYGARFDFDPVTHACRGLLIEQQSTNLLLNSAALSSQMVTLSSAYNYVLSFYGTGTVTISGAASSVVVGVGAYPARKVFPISGNDDILLTVTGTVSYANLEQLPSQFTDASATSYIPTSTATSTRSADVCTISGSDFSGIWNQNEGTLAIACSISYNTNASYVQANSSSGRIGIDAAVDPYQDYPFVIQAVFIDENTWLNAISIDEANHKFSLSYTGRSTKYANNPFVVSCSVDGKTAVDNYSAMALNITNADNLKIGSGIVYGYPVTANTRISTLLYFSKSMSEDKQRRLSS